MKHHAVPAVAKTPPAKQATPDSCQDCGQGLHITAVRFSVRRARALFSCADCGWRFAES
jgi:predicted RNA-binding Zn-ribbon protein involved in translation (DUF1610 family)